MTTEQEKFHKLRDQVATLEARAMKLHKELAKKRQQLAELECPFKVGDYVKHTHVNWSGQTREKVYHLSRILPRPYGRGGYRLRGYPVRVNGEDSKRDREIFVVDKDTLVLTDKPEPKAEPKKKAVKKKATKGTGKRVAKKAAKKKAVKK